MFHVSLLVLYVAGKDYKPPPLPIVVNEALEYEVERALMHRSRNYGQKTCMVPSTSGRVMGRSITHGSRSPI